MRLLAFLANALAAPSAFKYDSASQAVPTFPLVASRPHGVTVSFRVFIHGSMREELSRRDHSRDHGPSTKIRFGRRDRASGSTVLGSVAIGIFFRHSLGAETSQFFSLFLAISLFLFEKSVIFLLRCPKHRLRLRLCIFHVNGPSCSMRICTMGALKEFHHPDRRYCRRRF